MTKKLVIGLVLVVAIGFGIKQLRGHRPTAEAPAKQTPDQKVVVNDLQRFDLTAGKGEVAAPGKKAEVQVQVRSARGKLLHDDVADKKTEWVEVTDKVTDKPIGFYVENMKVGGHRRVTVPWGEQYHNAHESGEPLIFEIFLKAVK